MNARVRQSLLSVPSRTKAAARMSLANSILLLTCISVFVSTSLIGGLNYLQIEDLVYRTSVEKLPGETRLLAQRFKQSYDEMRTDTLVLAETPPIMGLVRSIRAGGVDPSDGSTTDIWRERLSVIFASLMNGRSHYTQIRYLGISDSGREIVRVNRTPSGVEVVAEDALQRKGQEPYFVSGMQTPLGKVHFSEVSHNRENGRIEAEMTPTIRTVTPIYDERNRIFGMIVINARYDWLLQKTFEEIAPHENIIVVNHAGDFMEHVPGRGTRALEIHNAYTRTPPGLVAEVVESERSEGLFQTSDTVSYFIKMIVDPLVPNRFLAVTKNLPLEQMLAPAHEARTRNLITAGVLIAFCVFAAMLLARKFTQPLLRMTDEVKRAGGRVLPENLPVNRQDEIGDLARAFARKSRELGDTEIKSRAVIDNVVDGLVTIDENGIVDSYNPACERIFGYSADEVIGQNVSMLMAEPHRSAHDGYLRHYHRTGEHRVIGMTRELEGQRKDGSTFPLDLAVSELLLDDRRMFSGIIRDISERKMMDVMKDEFVSTVNHELRTPLTSIQGALGLLSLKQGVLGDQKSQRLVQLSYENCQRLSRLVNDILDIEKMAAGKMDYRIETTELCALVANIVESQSSYAERFSVTFELDFKIADVHVDIDADRFSQALVNLLSNAAKFSAPGDNVQIAMGLGADSNVQISVRDHGPGIAASFKDKIFEKFAQADSSATRQQQGSGLGLNITKTIVEAFGGSLWFETAEGQGTAFYLSLPITTPDQKRA